MRNKPRYRVNEGGIVDIAARAPKRPPPESSPESSSESGDDATPPIAPPTDAVCDPPAAPEADDDDGPGKLPKLSARTRPPVGTVGRKCRR